jgi:hypothetical protein
MPAPSGLIRDSDLSPTVHREVVDGGGGDAVGVDRLVHRHVQHVVVEAALADQLEVVGVGVHRRERRAGVPLLVVGRRVRVLEAGQDAGAAELAVQVILDPVTTGGVGRGGDDDVDVPAEVDDVPRRACASESRGARGRCRTGRGSSGWPSVSLASWLPRQQSPLDDHLYGNDSETKRQIDVSIRWSDRGQEYLTIVQAKDWGRRADIPAVGEFAQVVEDVRATRGVMVCRSGFTANAKTLARNKGIGLYNLHDAESRDWCLDLTIPLLWIDLHPTAVFNQRIYLERGEALLLEDGLPILSTKPGENWVHPTTRGCPGSRRS